MAQLRSAAPSSRPAGATVAERWLRAFDPMIRAMNRSLEQVSSVDGAVRFVAEHGVALIPGVQCVVGIVQAGRPHTFVVTAGAGGAWAEALAGTEWPVEGTLYGRAMLQGSPLETTRAAGESALPWAFGDANIETGRLVPLRAGTPPARARRAVGAIGFWREGNEPFDDDDSTLADLYGELASVIVHRAELVQGVRRAERRVRATAQPADVLQEAAGSLSGTLEPDRIHQETVLLAARIMTPPGGSPCRSALLAVNDGVASITAEYDQQGVQLAGEQYDIATHPLIRRVIDQLTTVCVDVRGPDVADASLTRLRDLAITWAVMTPIVLDKRVAAILRVATRDGVPFSEEHLARVDALASVAAMAIGNAERYQLAQSEAQRLAALERAKSDFLRLASHELRGPLAVVRGYLSMYEDGSLPSVRGAARDALPVINSRLLQMSRMVDDMLETARLDDRRLSLDVGVIDLRDVARRAAGEVHADPSLHPISVDAGDQPLMIAADAGRVTTIIRNLVDNAVRYSPDGGRVTITARRFGDSAEVAVADEGIGIAAADIPRLFERFGRIVTSENSHIAGTGLGLHLSRELARLHEGDIRVESTEGAGSTFRLRLPIATA